MRPILKNRLYLYLTEFFAGMAVMAVELGASRLLGMRVIDDLIRDEVAWYRRIYEQYGVQGLLSML